MCKADEAISIGGGFAINTVAFMESRWKCAVLLAITSYISVALVRAVSLQGLTDKSCKPNTVTH